MLTYTTRFFVAFLVIFVVMNAAVQGEDWPQWRGPQRDGVWHASGIVDTLPEQFSFQWRVPLGGGFSGPAVVGERVYVTDRTLPEGTENPENRWDRTDPVNGDERVLCLDADSGDTIWEVRYACRYTLSYPAGPRATPTVSNGRVYALGAMGDLLCLDAATGRTVWSKNYVADFGTKMNMWGMAAAPLADGDRLIVLPGAGDDACAVALDASTGQEIWRALDGDDPGYSSPIIIQAGGVRQLIVWNPIGLHSLNPTTGDIYWSQTFPTKMGHSVATPVYDTKSRRLLVSSFFNGSLLMQLDEHQPTARELWRGTSDSELPQSTAGLHCLMSTPVISGQEVFGVCSYGHLRCLDLNSGQRIWETLEATQKWRWSNAYLVPYQDRYFIFNEQGQLILARLSRSGYQEIGRAMLIAPTNRASRRDVVWAHPAFANRCVYARNDRELVCVRLASEPR